MKPVIKDLGKVCITPEGDWDIKKEYANLSVVFNRNDAKVYISKQCVPKDIDILNTDYWHLLVDFDSIVNDMTTLEIKNYVDIAIREYIGNVPDEYNSLEKISNWIESLKTANTTLSNNLEKEINNRINSDNDIKNKAALFGATVVKSNKNSIDIEYKNVSKDSIGMINIPSATINNAGIMSANDKQKLEASAESFEVFVEKERVGLEISANSGNLSEVYIPAATTETAGVMSAEDKNIIDTAPIELLKRIQGTSEKSSATNDPFKRYPTTFSSVTDVEFMEALNIMHSTVSTSGVEGFWRLYIGRLAVEVKNVAIKYVDDIWVQTIKLPYKWYKSSGNFGIDDDSNYHIHTYYRIHKDGIWGDWKEVEEELKSIIIAEEIRAKAEETAIRKLITDLIGESPKTLDSIHEISSWILNDKTGAAAMAKAISDNKTAIETEQERAMNAEDGLADEISRETSARISSDNDIKSKAVLFGMITTESDTNNVTIKYKDVNQNVTGMINIPAATPEKAGVMTSNDKTKIESGFVGTTQTSEIIKLNTYILEGVFNFINVTLESESPINNNSVVSGRLTVFSTQRYDNKVITQVLTLNNNVGGESNVYIRSQQNGTWKPWGKLQTNIEVGQITPDGMSNLIDNGIYSGVCVDNETVETFVLIVINNYFAASQAGFGSYISQLKYAIDLNRGNTVKTRTRDAYGIWNEWSEIGSSTYELPKATCEILGGVKLGSNNDDQHYTPLSDIPSKYGNGVGIKIDSSVLINSKNGLTIHHNNSLIYNNGLSVNLGTDASDIYKLSLIIPCAYGAGESSDGSIWNFPSVGIPYNQEQFCLKGNGLNLKDDIGSGTTRVTWGANSNMNNYIEPGIYDIYGERTVKTDNLPITNDGSGHSIAARLTVVASTLQPNNTEKCITQFLQLSNRIGGEGNTYIRTYNENNNGLNGWSPWKKQQGIVESYINTDTIGMTTTGKQTTGLCGMTENGMYSGIYTDDYTLQAPTFVETFVLVVINDYAVSSQAGTQRRISQLKYATDTLTGQCTVKKRVSIDDYGDHWGEWEEISNKVDITDAVYQYGLPTLILQRFVQEGVTYVATIDFSKSLPILWDGDTDLIITDILNTIGDIGAGGVTLEIKKYTYQIGEQEYDRYLIKVIGDIYGCNEYLVIYNHNRDKFEKPEVLYRSEYL